MYSQYMKHIITVGFSIASIPNPVTNPFIKFESFQIPYQISFGFKYLQISLLVIMNYTNTQSVCCVEWC